MDNITTTEPAGKRARNGSVILADRLCEKRVAKRVKFYDRASTSASSLLG